jgi:hypothetical protein
VGGFLVTPTICEGVMPSKSEKQHRFMQAAAHNPQFAKKAGISPKLAKEFIEADKKSGRK